MEKIRQEKSMLLGVLPKKISIVFLVLGESR